jgi:hypothetical protein
LKLANFGDPPATQTLPLQIWFKPCNEAKLKELLAAAGSQIADYHHWWVRSKVWAAATTGDVKKQVNQPRAANRAFGGIEGDRRQRPT